MSRRLCPRDKSHRVNARFSWKILLRWRNFVPATCPLNSNQFELRGHVAATKQRYTPVKRKVASCELFMRHVPATLRKINQSENEITTCPCDKTLRVNTSRNLPPQHAPSCEQRMKFSPATCPCNMSPRVSRPYKQGWQLFPTVAATRREFRQNFNVSANRSEIRFRDVKDR